MPKAGFEAEGETCMELVMWQTATPYGCFEI
jgi:hypothetical protein